MKLVIETSEEINEDNPCEGCIFYDGYSIDNVECAGFKVMEKLGMFNCEEKKIIYKGAQYEMSSRKRIKQTNERMGSKRERRRSGTK